MKLIPAALAALALACAGSAFADKSKGKDKQHQQHSASEHAPGPGKHGTPKFSSGERDQIHAYFAANPGAREQLPPGLAKKNKIPPGWQKKIAPGQRIPDDIWVHRVPLPHEVLGLPPPPIGVIHVRIQDRVLRVVEKTHEVLDDLGLPHPPTPRR